MKLIRRVRYIILHGYNKPGSIVTDYSGTRFYEVQANGSIRRVEKPEGEAI